MSEEDYVAMVADHNGQCGICYRTVGQLYIDHCHKTGVVRGLLCLQCNTGLGNFKDDPALLNVAIKYLTK